MTLYNDLLRLASEHAPLRAHLVPLLRGHISSTGCTQIKGPERAAYLNAVWAMYESTYRAIGLIVTNPQALLAEYPVWELCLDGETPRTFTLYKPTSFGLKFGLSGSDGSSEGKSLTVQGIRTVFKQSGYYAEVSHKVRDIALAAGAPVVCSTYVEKILGKQVEPLEDGISYRRTLANVGPVVKTMVGKPRGIPTTTVDHPNCPVAGAKATFASEPDTEGLDAHYACMALE